MDHDLYEEPAKPPKNDPGWKDMLLVWEKEFFVGLEELGRPEKVNACRIPIKKAVRSTLDWCIQNGVSLWETKEKMGDAAYLVRDLYEALTNDLIEAPKMKPRTTYWRHVRVSHFIASAAPNELTNTLHPGAIKEVANTYIARPWVQNPYLDWVLLEALILGENLLFLDQVMKARNGLSYAMYGFGWKAAAFRLVSKPVVFALGWILPGVLFLWLAASYPLAASLIGLAYYGVSVFLLVKFIVGKVRYRLREGAFPMRKLGELLGLMDAAYEQMSEELIHVPSLQKAIAAARDKGAIWPSQVYVILDSVASRSPSGWDRGVGWSGR